MKKIIYVMLSVMVFVSSLPVNAMESVNPTITYYKMPYVSEYQKRNEIEKELRKWYNLSNQAIINIKAGDKFTQDFSPMDKKELVGTVHKTEFLGAAGNQYSKGVYFKDGGYIYWREGGPTVSVSFGLSGGIFSVSVSVGNKSDGVTGYAAYCKPEMWCKLYVTKDLEISRYYYEIDDVASGLKTSGYYNQAVTLGVTLETY